MAKIRSGEILFIKGVKDGIPNRDPLNDSDARRIFSEDDGRISLSDVSIKRDVRDYVLSKYPNGGDDRRYFTFVRQERTADGHLLGRASLAESLKDRADVEFTTMREFLCRTAFDVRTFGAVYSVKKENFQLTGPVQFGWAHSLHPVETVYVQGTVVMPAQNVKVTETGDEEGKTQGTIWTTYTLPFAVFAMPGVINTALAEMTAMDEQDQELLLEALWRGTQNRQARGRGFQQPLFLLHVEYSDPFFRIGYLEEGVRLLPEREAWLSGPRPSSLADIELDVRGMADLLNRNRERIARCRYWLNPSLCLKGQLPAEARELW